MYSTLMYSADAGPVCRRALHEWGPDGQVAVAVEELSELIRALARFHTPGRFSVENLIEEIADVLIVLEQMMVLHACHEEVENVYQEIFHTMDMEDEPVALLRHKLEMLLVELDGYFLDDLNKRCMINLMGNVSRSLETIVDRWSLHEEVGAAVNEKIAKLIKKLDAE